MTRLNGPGGALPEIVSRSNTPFPFTSQTIQENIISNIDPLNPSADQLVAALQKQGITDLAQLVQLAVQPSDAGETAKWAFIVKHKFIYKDDEAQAQAQGQASSLSVTLMK